MDDDSLDGGDLRLAVLTAAYVPEHLPERVAAAGVVAVSPPNSPARVAFDRWRIEPSSSRTAEAVADVCRLSIEGRPCDAAIERVRKVYGFGGLVAALGIGAATRMYNGFRGETPRPGSVSRRQVPGDDQVRATSIHIRRSFGRVPMPWNQLGWEPRSHSRWWELHEWVMRPGRLTPEEKRLALVASADALALTDLADAYRGLVSGRSVEDLDMILARKIPRLRRGLGEALTSIHPYVTGGLEAERFELAAAALPESLAGELTEIIDLVSGLAGFAVLS